MNPPKAPSAAPGGRPAAAPGVPDGSSAQKARRVEELLRRLSELPTLPAAAAKLLELSADEAADSAEVVRLIESDPALSVAVLRLLGRLDRTSQSKPASIERAVLSVGFRAVRDAALAVGVLTALPAPAGIDAAGLDSRGFWTHGVAVGAAAERLAAACPSAGVSPRDAFLPGLLHDLGKLALQVALPEAYVRVVQAARRHGLPLADAELRVLGIDHQTAGRRLARQWGLPDAITECVWLHGTSPLAMPAGPHAGLVHLVTAADAIARVRHLGESGSHDAAGVPVATLDALGLSPAAAEEALGGLEAEVAARVEAMGLSPAGEADPLRLYASAVGSAHAALLATNRRLEEAARRGAEREKTLTLLDAFLPAAAAARDAGLGAVAAAVATSALGGLGATRCVLAVPAADATPDARPDAGPASPGAWLVVGTGGRVARRVEPAGAAWPPSPTALAAALDEPELAHLRPLVLREPVAAGVESEAVGVLLSDGGRGFGEAATLANAWAAALLAGTDAERADRASERLASANRRIEAGQAAMAGRAADARLREIAAGAAHEMNNPLAVILGRCEQLCPRLDGDELPLVKAAQQSARRLAELVEGLNLFSRPPTARRRPTDAARLAGEAVEAVRASRPLRREQMEPLEVTLRPGEGLDAVAVDAGMLRRSLDELVTNALQAHPASFLTVRVFLEEADEADDAADPDAPDGRALVVEVSDDGTGLDERTLQHAADPFFSRHAAGRRAGLGLSRVTVWADAHGGGLRLRPRAGGGCTARLRLPLF